MGATAVTEPQLLMLARALAYARRGWAVLPCGGDKAPLGELAPHGVKNATTNEATIKRWWTKHLKANIGIATGSPSGIFAVDIGAFGWTELLTLGHHAQSVTLCSAPSMLVAFAPIAGPLGTMCLRATHTLR
jgi:hypothetical protein